MGVCSRSIIDYRASADRGVGHCILARMALRTSSSLLTATASIHLPPWSLQNVLGRTSLLKPLRLLVLSTTMLFLKHTVPKSRSLNALILLIRLPIAIRTALTTSKTPTMTTAHFSCFTARTGPSKARYSLLIPTLSPVFCYISAIFKGSTEPFYFVSVFYSLFDTSKKIWHFFRF